MRPISLAVLFAAVAIGCGKAKPELTEPATPAVVIAPPAKSPEQEKKVETPPKEVVEYPRPKKVDEFTEKVTVRPYGGPGRFLDPHKDRPAYRRTEKDGREFIVIKAGFGIDYAAGSEIEQADGTVWIVVKTHYGAEGDNIEVKKKPK